MKRNKLALRYSLQCVRWIMAFGLIIALSQDAASQDRRVKVRISNAGFTITALPLLAAKDWSVFNANGLDVELIVMSPTLAAAAIAQGDIDYVAGVGPASVAATLTGLPSRAIWFSSDRVSYWLQSAPQTFSAARKGFNKLLDVGAMVEMPGGGLTTLIKTIQSRPAEVRRIIHALQLAKDEVRKSKPKTVELIIRLLKMDKETASETYDAFQATLNPTGIPNRAGIDNLVRSLQAQSRFT